MLIVLQLLTESSIVWRHACKDYCTAVALHVADSSARLKKSESQELFFLLARFRTTSSHAAVVNKATRPLSTSRQVHIAKSIRGRTRGGEVGCRSVVPEAL